MVLKPVAIVSADSRVVARTEVNRAINSLTLPPAASKTPPTRRIAVIRSPDSTAKLLDTELMASIVCSRNLTSPPAALASVLNCLKTAIAPSVVSFRFSKVAPRLVLARISRAPLVFLASKPA